MLHIGSLISIIINECKMILQAGYHCIMGQIWPAGLEFDTCDLRGKLPFVLGSIFCLHCGRRAVI